MIESDVERSLYFFTKDFLFFIFHFVKVSASHRNEIFTDINVERACDWQLIWAEWRSRVTRSVNAFVPAHGEKKKTFSFRLIFLDSLSAGKLLLIDGHIVERLAMLFALLNHQHMLNSLDCESFDFLKEIGIWLNELLEIFFAESAMKNWSEISLAAVHVDGCVMRFIDWLHSV